VVVRIIRWHLELVIVPVRMGFLVFTRPYRVNRLEVNRRTAVAPTDRNYVCHRTHGFTRRRSQPAGVSPSIGYFYFSSAGELLRGSGSGAPAVLFPGWFPTCGCGR